MVADNLAPFGPVFTVFKFKNSFYVKPPGVSGSAKTDNPKTAAANVANKFAWAQMLVLAYAGNYAVKMNCAACAFIG